MNGLRDPRRQIDRVAVRGKDQAVGLYQVLDDELLADERHLSRFDRSMKWYLEGEFQLAATGFTQLAEHDPTAAMLARRCETLPPGPPRAAGRDIGSWRSVPMRPIASGERVCAPFFVKNQLSAGNFSRDCTFLSRF